MLNNFLRAIGLKKSEQEQSMFQLFYHSRIGFLQHYKHTMTKNKLTVFCPDIIESFYTDFENEVSLQLVLTESNKHEIGAHYQLSHDLDDDLYLLDSAGVELSSKEEVIAELTEHLSRKPQSTGEGINKMTDFVTSTFGIYSASMQTSIQ